MSEEAQGTPVASGIVSVTSTEVNERTKVRPLGDRVFVLEDDAPTETKSGIIIPDSAKGTTRRGRVIAFGPGLRSPLTGEPTGMGLKEGDRIIYAPMSGIEITVDGVALLVVRESDIISVFSTTDDE
jgi:chaperonin GroES